MMQNKKKNIILFGGLLLLIGVAFLIRGVLYSGQEAYIEIVCENEVRYTFDMDETKTIRVEHPDGSYNVVCIEQGTVWVEDADCDNHDCIKQGRISKVGQSVICLPHQMVIRIVGTQDSEYDAVVQ